MGVHHLILESPEGKPPTLDQEVLSELDQALQDLKRSAPAVLIVTSSSPHYFCVGANLNVLRDTTEESVIPWVELGHDVLNRLEEFPCPVLARISGYAMGGGLELAMACDLILAVEGAKFAQSEASLGFIPGWGGSFRLPERIGYARAKQMFFTGRVLDAPTAVAWGLADAHGGSAEIDDMLNGWVSAIKNHSSYALKTFKRILLDEQKAARERGRKAEVYYSRGCLKEPDTLNRVRNFLEKKTS